MLNAKFGGVLNQTTAAVTVGCDERLILEPSPKGSLADTDGGKGLREGRGGVAAAGAPHKNVRDGVGDGEAGVAFEPEELADGVDL